MAITSAIRTLLKHSVLFSPTTYVQIGQVRSISGPTVKPNIVDVTTHSTSLNWREKLAVLVDPGTVGFEVNWDKADATHTFTTGMWNQMVNLTKTAYQITYPNSAGVLAFLGYYSQHEFSAPVDNVLSAKIQVDITGAITAS